MTPLRAVEACVFDAYGTLFDVNAAARHRRADLGDQADALAELWRAKQLQYTWLRSLMGRYADFWQVTSDALDYALAALDLRDATLHERLLDLYRTLDAYPDVAPTLERLAAAGRRTAILSNGSPAMLAAAVAHAGLADRFDAVLSVDEVGIYKPHPDVYRLAANRLALAPARIAFVSANAWDVAGAAAFGFQAVWLNRSGGQAERLPAQPAAEIAVLSELPALLAPADGEP